MAGWLMKTPYSTTGRKIINMSRRRMLNWLHKGQSPDSQFDAFSCIIDLIVNEHVLYKFVKNMNCYFESI